MNKLFLKYFFLALLVVVADFLLTGYIHHGALLLSVYGAIKSESIVSKSIFSVLSLAFLYIFYGFYIK